MDQFSTEMLHVEIKLYFEKIYPVVKGLTTKVSQDMAESHWPLSDRQTYSKYFDNGDDQFRVPWYTIPVIKWLSHCLVCDVRSKCY